MDVEMLRLSVLDDVAMNLQCIDTINPVAEKRQIAEAIVSAIEDGLIEALTWGAGSYLGRYGRATPTPTVADIENDSYPFAKYWFDITPVGQRVLDDGGDRLAAYWDAYYDAHPDELIDPEQPPDDGC